jgi:hypothetical protein
MPTLAAPPQRWRRQLRQRQTPAKRRPRGGAALATMQVSGLQRARPPCARPPQPRTQAAACRPGMPQRRPRRATPHLAPPRPTGQGQAQPELQRSPEPRASPSKSAARKMGSAVMRALHSSYNPFRMLRTSPGKAGPVGLEQEQEQADELVGERRQQEGATVHVVGSWAAGLPGCLAVPARAGQTSWRQRRRSCSHGFAPTSPSAPARQVSTAHRQLVARVQDVLLWRDAAASARVFGAGMYLIICMHHLPTGAPAPPAAAASRAPPAPALAERALPPTTGAPRPAQAWTTCSR